MFFTEFEEYVDGGVLANNPCSYGFSAIQNFHRLVVHSVGSHRTTLCGPWFATWETAGAAWLGNKYG
jgi:hypothetical protein